MAQQDLHGLMEARGAEVTGTRIHPARLRSLVVTTDIVFAASGEGLIMGHDQGLTPDTYVAGTLLAIRRASDVAGARRADSLLFKERTAGR
jgi:4-hydroxy-tetrahydrodipicolinate reductase